ncbi:MAG: hypothetical protein FWD68_18775 [Alphaproteobacteria bacterium]|nr:hypothetical protein [Alphaproteobacteria bacterium]
MRRYRDGSFSICRNGALKWDCRSMRAATAATGRTQSVCAVSASSGFFARIFLNLSDRIVHGGDDGKRMGGGERENVRLKFTCGIVASWRRCLRDPGRW